MNGQWKPRGEPEEAVRERRRGARMVPYAALGIVCVLVLIYGIILWIAGAFESYTPQPATPPSNVAVPLQDGDYRITVAHTGLCLGAKEQPGHERFVMMQVDCSAAIPRLSLEQRDGRTFRILMHYPELDWIACMSLDGDDAGYLYGPQQCEKDMIHDFVMEPAAEGTYLIKSPAGKCMDVLDGSDDVDALFSAAECAEGSASQRYRFERL